MMNYRVLILSSLLMGCYVGDEVPPDQTVWEYALPAEVGLSEDGLLGLNTGILFEGFETINGLIIVKDDQLAFENYYGSWDRATLQAIDRASIVFTLSALSIAEDLRLLSLDDVIDQYLPEYEDVFQEDPEKRMIRIRDFLTHKSGLAWNENINPFSVFSDLSQMKASSDWVRYVLERPREAPAGFRYSFNTGGGMILCKIIENATGQSFDSFLQEQLLEPLTIEGLQIEQDPLGNFNGGDGISVSLIDFTKLGYLMLQEGEWRKRVIIDPAFIQESTSLQVPVDVNYNLGYGWWLFGADQQASFPMGEQVIFFIPGEKGQHMYIIPSENMIVSIFAENVFYLFQNPSLDLFKEITYTVE